MSSDSSAGPAPAILRFIARFDRREYWLAHEELEELWLEDRRDLFKGLIQLAAAFVHVERGNRHGARRLLQTSLRYLRPYPATSDGFALDEIRARVSKILAAIDPPDTGEAELADEALRFELSACYSEPVPDNLVEDVELPYRARRYEEGYRRRRGSR